MKIGILGAGAMGQLFGARLQLAGNDVVFIDVAAETIEALNRDGITLITDGVTEQTPARAGTARDFTEPLELLVVFTKGFHTAAAMESVRHLVGARSKGLTLQNGLGNAEILAQEFGEERTWIGITDFPADLERPGVIGTSSGGKVRLGTMTGSAVPETAALAETLNSARLNATAVEGIHESIWEKIAFNAALNTLSAVTGQTVGEIGANDDSRSIVNRVLDETINVARAQGIRLQRDRVESALENAFEHHTDHKTSMLQDRLAGRRTEVDSIGGAVVRLGQEAGIPVPVLWTLSSLVRVAAPSKIPVANN
jgi:2-dehydropantoate 2-reductase